MFQEAGTPWWLRDGWPLVWRGDTLVAVPGIAVAAAYAASGEMPGYELRWRPAG
jgi:tRNA(Ile)-lysidine synthase